MTASERIREARSQNETRKTRTHSETVERYNLPGECCVEVADWPYDCIAKDKNPNATVYICLTHSCWWHD